MKPGLPGTSAVRCGGPRRMDLVGAATWFPTKQVEESCALVDDNGVPHLLLVRHILRNIARRRNAGAPSRGARFDVVTRERAVSADVVHQLFSTWLR